MSRHAAIAPLGLAIVAWLQGHLGAGGSLEALGVGVVEMTDELPIPVTADELETLLPAVTLEFLRWELPDGREGRKVGGPKSAGLWRLHYHRALAEGEAAGRLALADAEQLADLFLAHPNLEAPAGLWSQQNASNTGFVPHALYPTAIQPDRGLLLDDILIEDIAIDLVVEGTHYQTPPAVV